MIFRRWDEVKALREAFDDLVDRMQDIVEVSLQKISHGASDRGLSSEFDLKRPSVWFWKGAWATRRNEPGIYLLLLDFAPTEYGKSVEEHPSMWLMTDGFTKLKMRESVEEFGRAVRDALSSELLKKWNHEKVDLSQWPLGKDCHDISEADRVRLVSEPDALRTFIMERLDEFMELVPAIEQALQNMTRR